MNAEGAPPAAGPAASHWDPLVGHLRAHRESVGSPSYRLLAERVAAARVERGIDPYAARVGKTTVYDCFQLGRPRVNLELAREVAAAMDAGPAEVDAWIASCRQPVPSTPLALEGEAAEPLRHALLLMAAMVGLNLLGREFVLVFDFPFHLDMVGTAVVAIALGPWRGAAVGVTTGLVGIALSGSSSLPFALVSVVGALAWGYGVRRFGGGATIPRFVSLNLVTALLCSLVAVPILLGLYDGATRHSFDHVTGAFNQLWSSYAASVLFSNTVTSAVDKLLSGFLALAVLAALPLALRPALPLIADRRD